VGTLVELDGDGDAIVVVVVGPVVRSTVGPAVGDSVEVVGRLVSPLGKVFGGPAFGPLVGLKTGLAVRLSPSLDGATEGYTEAVVEGVSKTCGFVKTVAPLAMTAFPFCAEFSITILPPEKTGFPPENITWSSTVGTAEGAAEGDTEGMAEGDTEGSAEGDTEGMAEGDTEGMAAGDADGATEGTTEGAAEGPETGLGVGDPGWSSNMGLRVGRSVSPKRGLDEGLSETLNSSKVENPLAVFERLPDLFWTSTTATVEVVATVAITAAAIATFANIVSPVDAAAAIVPAPAAAEVPAAVAAWAAMDWTVAWNLHIKTETQSQQVYNWIVQTLDLPVHLRRSRRRRLHPCRNGSSHQIFWWFLRRLGPHRSYRRIEIITKVHGHIQNQVVIPCVEPVP
jgi:hypothetical protein